MQDLNDLYYFVQAVEHGGFAPAGRALGQPKSLLSRRIARLEERLGRTRAPAYRLSYTIGTTTEGQGITTTNAVTRFRVNGTIDFALTDSATDAVLSRGTVSSFTSYSASGTPVSTVASEEDANKRLMRLLADQIVTRLIATSGQWNRG